MKAPAIILGILMASTCFGFASDVEADRLTVLGNIVTEAQISFRAMPLEQQAKFRPVLSKMLNIYGEKMTATIAGVPLENLACDSDLEITAAAYRSYLTVSSLVRQSDLENRPVGELASIQKQRKSDLMRAQQDYLSCLKETN